MKSRFGAIPAADISADQAIPPAEIAVAPTTLEEASEALRIATERRMKVLIWGGGNHQGYGHRVHPDMVLVTTSLNRVEVWEPEDLTIVAGAGARVSQVEEMLADERQTTLLPHSSPTATIGGALAAGLSSYKRYRYGPSRDRVLETTVVTGDGRIVRSGGRVVKNVTGYDIPRLMVGALGRLGLIGSVCLKLIPTPAAAVTVSVDDPAAALAVLYRPLAVLSTPSGHSAYLWGTQAEVESQASRLGGEVQSGHAWPLMRSRPVAWSLRLPPSRMTEGLERLPDSWDYVAQQGVGITECVADQDEIGAASELRGWAESVGGALVLTNGPETLYERIDPWGGPPAGLEYQRKLVAGFDPYRVLNGGRLPGGI